jgi:hypothetical protein
VANFLQTGALNQQTAAAKAAFAREAVASLKAHGIDVLADLAKAYLSTDKPLPHQQRYLYTMLRHVERARIAEATAAIAVEAAPGPPAMSSPEIFLANALRAAGQEVQDFRQLAQVRVAQPSEIALKSVTESDEISTNRKNAAPPLTRDHRPPAANQPRLSKRQLKRLARR